MLKTHAATDLRIRCNTFPYDAVVFDINDATTFAEGVHRGTFGACEQYVLDRLNEKRGADV